MFAYTLQGTVAVLAAMTAACAPTERGLTETHAEAIRDSVRQMLADYGRFSTEGLRDSVLALYADTSVFRWVEDGAVRYRSGNEVREALAALPSTARVQTTLQNTEIIPLGPGLASVVTGFTTQFVDSTGPASVSAAQ
ncbi:MAG: hypothetical protein OEO20_07440 [Gemmatimonadota bacterium]|nr:hypothetical protein [Gemmatimonadota bacterium]MDH3478122.1 hypothetical protein [Gemmatimonadota bacterium]MDH3570168.1 hypothetical protein [Gemmatimonadota bacterium]